jgi:hypothetical protein
VTDVGTWTGTEETCLCCHGEGGARESQKYADWKWHGDRIGVGGVVDWQASVWLKPWCRGGAKGVDQIGGSKGAPEVESTLKGECHGLGRMGRLIGVQGGCGFFAPQDA